MAEKSDIDDSSVKPENFNTTDSKWEKDDSPQSYQEWDNDKLIAIIQSLTSGLELGRGALSALKASGECGLTVERWTKEYLEKINISNNTDQVVLLGARCLISPSIPTMIVHHPQEDYKIINDPVHGHIQLTSILMGIIDTPQFQRLRDIKQLGCTYRVFPGASHNRFEHSIGVCHLAGELVLALAQTQPELGITATDVLCVKIAGLCYNLGHGPFSKVFSQVCDKQLCEKHQMKWSMEAASVVMFRHLIVENLPLRSRLEREGIGEGELKFIESLMDPEHTQPQPANGSKRFLRDIVRNHRTCIDVETMDSIARDSYLLNIRCTFDHNRIVKFVQVNEVKGEKRLCFRDKEAQDLYDMLLSRLSLQRKAYKHKTVRLIEKMMERALIQADEYLKLTEIAHDLLRGDEAATLAAAKKYTRLTDHVKDRIMDSEDESLKESRKLLQDIEKRELYKYVGMILYDPKKVDSEEQKQTDQSTNTANGEVQKQIDQLINTVRQGFSSADIPEEDVLIDWVKFRFGTESCENPVEEIKFYTKSNTHHEFPIRKDQVSLTLPERFTDVVVRVYSKNRDTNFVTNVQECFTRSIEGTGTSGLSWDYTPYASPRKTTLPVQRDTKPSTCGKPLFQE